MRTLIWWPPMFVLRAWFEEEVSERAFTQVYDFNLSEVEPCVSGPKRPQDRVPLADVAAATTKHVLGNLFSLIPL